MAFVVIGGVLGFLGAILGLIAFDLSWLAALAIWAGGGPVGAVVAALPVALRRGPQAGAEGARPLARIA